MLQKRNEIQMPILLNAKIVIKCKGMSTPLSWNVTECRPRNNGLLRNDLQTDLGTYIS